jgi:hypothetical protein
VKNPKLLDLLIDLSEFCELMYKKNIVLTSVFRDETEQAELYKQSTHKVLKSAHGTYEAVDLRSSTFTAHEIETICSYLNTKYKNKNGKKVAIAHAIPGNVMHFHIALYR